MTLNPHGYKELSIGSSVAHISAASFFLPHSKAVVSLCISRDPEVHAKYAQRFIDLGFDRLCFHSAGPDQYEFIDGYGREVLPRIREEPGTR